MSVKMIDSARKQ